MKKIITLSFVALAMTVLLTENVFAAKALRYPQGRIGTGYKTEKYKPLSKTNMTPAELMRISELIKEQEEVKKQIIKEYNEKLAKERELKKQQLKQAEEQKKIEISKQKEQLRLEQIRKEQQEKQKLAEQKQAELQKAKEEQQKKAELKKQQAEELAEDNVEKQQTENKVQQFETIASKKFERVKGLLSFKKNIEPKVSEENNVVKEEKNEVAKSDKEELPKQNIAPNPNQDPQTRAIVKEISTELANDKDTMLEELSTLWVSAVQKSDTVYFAIMKLSNPNGEEVNKKGFKKILEPILSAAPLVGQAFVNPALTAGSLIGSNVMGAMMNDSAARRLTKVNDADLVILARAIDELQENLLLNYMTYKNALKEYELAIKITAERKKVYDKLNKENSPSVVLANTFYTEALDNQYKARQDFLMKRVVLEQMVGSDALNEIETKKVEQTEQVEQKKQE